VSEEKAEKGRRERVKDVKKAPLIGFGVDIPIRLWGEDNTQFTV
jgi:hypothetical protein